MAEVFILGQLVGSQQFEIRSLFCKWKLIAGSGWKLLEGVAEGQTQIDSNKSGTTCWSHPIDIHLATKGIQGWPKLLLEVWSKDQFERCSLISYGVVGIPSQPGFNQVTCKTWRPLGSFTDRLANLFSGETLQLADECLIYSHEHRFNLQTEAMGEVSIEMSIILKNFDHFGVETH